MGPHPQSPFTHSSGRALLSQGPLAAAAAVGGGHQPSNNTVHACDGGGKAVDRINSKRGRQALEWLRKEECVYMACNDSSRWQIESRTQPPKAI